MKKRYSETTLREELASVAEQYRQSFRQKSFDNLEAEVDPLMKMFGITQEIKDANRQYWGRELGMCWQRLVVATVKAIRTQWSQLPQWMRDACRSNTTASGMEDCFINKTMSWQQEHPDEKPGWKLIR